MPESPMTPHDRTDPAFVLAERIAVALGFERVEGLSDPSWTGLINGNVGSVQSCLSGHALSPLTVWVFLPTQTTQIIFRLAGDHATVECWFVEPTSVDRDICRTIDNATDGFFSFALQNAGDERALRWYRGEE